MLMNVINILEMGKKKSTEISSFVKKMRKEFKLTQEDLAIRSGLSLHFIQNLEQGKTSLQMDKVNELLDFFNAELVVEAKKE